MQELPNAVQGRLFQGPQGGFHSRMSQVRAEVPTEETGGGCGDRIHHPDFTGNTTAPCSSRETDRPTDTSVERDRSEQIQPARRLGVQPVQGQPNDPLREACDAEHLWIEVGGLHQPNCAAADRRWLDLSSGLCSHEGEHGGNMRYDLLVGDRP